MKVDVRESLDSTHVFLYTDTGVLLCECPSRYIADVIGASLNHVLAINQEFFNAIELS